MVQPLETSCRCRFGRVKNGGETRERGSMFTTTEDATHVVTIGIKNGAVRSARGQYPIFGPIKQKMRSYMTAKIFMNLQ